MSWLQVWCAEVKTGTCVKSSAKVTASAQCLGIYEECNQVSYLDTIFKSQLEFMTQDKNVDLALLINFTMQEMGSCLSCLYSMSKCRKNDWLLKYTCRFRPKNLNIQQWCYLLLSERLHDMKRWYLIPWVSRKEEIVQWHQCSKHKSSLHVSFFSRKYRISTQILLLLWNTFSFFSRQMKGNVNSDFRTKIPFYNNYSLQAQQLTSNYLLIWMVAIKVLKMHRCPVKGNF